MNKYIMMSLIGLLTVFSTVAQAVVCVGHDYEQIVPTSDSSTTLPEVKLLGMPAIAKSNQAVELFVESKVGEGGQAFFYWCAEQGRFESNSSDYRSVTFYPPAVNGDTPVKVAVKMGDTLGYIDISLATVNVVNSFVRIENNSDTKDILITSLDPAINWATQGIISLNGQPIQATWSADGVSFNLYQATGTTFDTFFQPVKLDIRDANGQEIYVGCFPFKDVCTQRWYTKSIIKLWKANVIEGYNEGKSATFGTQNDTNRAEFIAALVRALEGNNPTALTTDPFSDVSKDKWYAPYVEYAKNMGWIQGCDTAKNLFCPDKPITRAEALKVLVLAYPHLKQLAEDYLRGKTPKKFYSDVKDKTQWYYPYIYAAQAINVAQGYNDNSFKPAEALKRSEMAQLVCIAQFGVMECTDMGDKAAKSVIFTVSPYKAQLNQSTTFTVYGIKLLETMMLSVQDCGTVTRTSHTPDLQTYQCTPTTNGVKTVKVLDNMDKTLYSGTLKVEGVVAPITLPGDTSTTTPPTEPTPTDPVVTPTDPVVVTPPENCTEPVVNEVVPSTATLGQETIFTVNGSCLSDTTAFYLDECYGEVPKSNPITISGGTAEQRQFRCTPGYKATIHNGEVKDQPKGKQLNAFKVSFQWGTPKVESVTPTTANLNQLTSFTIVGTSMPATTIAWIGFCEVKMIGGDANERTFQCTPIKSGDMKAVVKDRPDVKNSANEVISAGTELLNFTVTVK